MQARCWKMDKVELRNAQAGVNKVEVFVTNTKGIATIV
ncbi:hypothetical protein SAMD00079811_76220 (plasmid) [Scytonema sp. HK-05]|nr:hypothetical protein SAMD00079811_76220 [Scytonema sp. HK-05]